MKQQPTNSRRGPDHRSRRGTWRSAPACVRWGVTLIETLFATTGVAALSVVGLTSICLLMSAEQQSAESLWVERTIASLADQLRADAHAAQQVDLTAVTDDEAGACTWAFTGGRRAEYSCVSDGVIRRELRGDEVLATERFHLPFGRSWFSRPARAVTAGIGWHHERDLALTAGTLEGVPEEDRPHIFYRIEVFPKLYQRWALRAGWSSAETEDPNGPSEL